MFSWILGSSNGQDYEALLRHAFRKRLVQSAPIADAAFNKSLNRAVKLFAPNTKSLDKLMKLSKSEKAHDYEAEFSKIHGSHNELKGGEVFSRKHSVSDSKSELIWIVDENNDFDLETIVSFVAIICKPYHLNFCSVPAFSKSTRSFYFERR